MQESPVCSEQFDKDTGWTWGHMDGDPSQEKKRERWCVQEISCHGPCLHENINLWNKYSWSDLNHMLTSFPLGFLYQDQLIIILWQNAGDWKLCFEGDVGEWQQQVMLWHADTSSFITMPPGHQTSYQHSLAEWSGECRGDQCSAMPSDADALGVWLSGCIESSFQVKKGGDLVYSLHPSLPSECIFLKTFLISSSRQQIHPTCLNQSLPHQHSVWQTI